MRKIIIHKCQFYDDSFGTTAHSIKFCDNFEDAKAKILSDVKEYYEGDEEVNNCKTLDELSQLLTKDISCIYNDVKDSSPINTFVFMFEDNGKGAMYEVTFVDDNTENWQTI